MLSVNSATNHLVKLGDSYFKATNQSRTDRVIARLFSLALSLLLHTIATYHATCTGILKLSGASAEEIEKRKQACNVAFRECINLFLFGNFSKVMADHSATVLPAPIAKEKPGLPKEEVVKVSILPDADLEKAAPTLREMNINESPASSPAHTPPLRCRSVPASVISPRAHKGSVHLTAHRTEEKPVSVTVDGVPPLNLNPALSEESFNVAESDDDSLSSITVASSDGTNAEAAAPANPPKVKTPSVKASDKSSDCGSDGWVNIKKN